METTPDSTGHGFCPNCGHPTGQDQPGLIPDPAQYPTVPVWPVVGMAFGKKRSAILELARQGKLPVRVLRIGGSSRVPTADLLRVLGQDRPGDVGPPGLDDAIRRYQIHDGRYEVDTRQIGNAGLEL